MTSSNSGAARISLHANAFSRKTNDEIRRRVVRSLRLAEKHARTFSDHKQRLQADPDEESFIGSYRVVVL